MASLEHEAAQQPVQPSVRWEDTLVWLLGAQRPEKPAAEDCNKLLFLTYSCVCMKDPFCTWWECRNNALWEAGWEIILFLCSILHEFASSAPSRENLSDEASGIKTQHSVVPRFNRGAQAGVLTSSLHLSRSFLCSKALTDKRKKSHSSEKHTGECMMNKINITEKQLPVI